MSAVNTSAGCWVEIKSGKHRGKVVRFVKQTEQRVAVELDNGKVIYLLPDTIRKVQAEFSVENKYKVEDEDEYVFVDDSKIKSTDPDELEVPETNITRKLQIINGKHKGKTATFVKRTEKRVAVKFDDEKVIYLLPDTVRNMEHEDHATSKVLPNEQSKIAEKNVEKDSDIARPELLTSITEKSESRIKTMVKIVDGKYKGKIVRFLRNTAQRVAVQLDDGKVVYLIPSNVRNINNADGDKTHPNLVSDATNGDTETKFKSATSAAPDEESSIATRIKIIEGKHKGKTATFVKKTKKRVAVLFNDNKLVYLSPDAIENIEEREEETIFDITSVRDDEDYSDFVSALGTLEDDIAEMCEKHKPLTVVDILHGKHAGKKATLIKHTPKRIAVRMECETKIRYLSPTSIIPGLCNGSTIDESDEMVLSFLRLLPKSVTSVQNVTEELLKRTLFGKIFAVDNPIFFDLQISSVSTLPKSFHNHGQSFHLAAVKLHAKTKSLTCAYLPAPSTEHVANILLNIGSFDKLIPRKTAARLELLLSSAAQEDHILQLDASQFRMIEEKGNVGCGFIPRKMIDLLLGKPSPKVCALQVRIVIPRMGIFKGVLFEKTGIDKIELPPSMKKVNAALNLNPFNLTAWVLINKTGIYPYPARMQQKENDFQDKQNFPNMARWMLQQKGVSQTYLQKPNGQHSTLLGVADPTDTIPSGCVFLTGIHDHINEFGDNILISRFPMTEASDGRILPILREKPSNMSAKEWHFLCSKPFGIVIFGNPAPQSRPLPEQIAQGDLDGDGYHVTWDQNIIRDAIIGDRAIIASKNPPGSPPVNWWTESQEFMTDLDTRKNGQKLIGRLHDCWLRNIRAGLQHDAILFGRAYKEALVTVKHGGLIVLPRRLSSQLPRELHRFLHIQS